MNSERKSTESHRPEVAKPACTVCGCREIRQPFPDRFPRLYQCTSCRHGFTFPMPDDTELNAFYSDYPEYGELSPVTVRRYRELLQTFLPYRKHNRLLEIGCGDGFFLDLAREAGWEVYGTEYNPRSIAVCKAKGIRMQEGVVRPSEFQVPDFDVVLSLEVIEHTRGVHHEAEAMVTLCRPGGLIYLTTPNFLSLSRKILGPDWGVICYPEHLQYFSRRSLQRLFASRGCHTRSIRATGISPGRMLEGIRRRRNPNRYKPFVNTGPNEDQALRTSLDKGLLLEILRTLLNALLSPLGAGDTLKATFLKPEMNHGRA